MQYARARIYSQSHPKIRREPPSRDNNVGGYYRVVVIQQQQQQQQSAFLSPFNYVRSHCPLSLIKSNPSNRAKRERELWVLLLLSFARTRRVERERTSHHAAANRGRQAGRQASPHIHTTRTHTRFNTEVLLVQRRHYHRRGHQWIRARARKRMPVLLLLLLLETPTRLLLLTFVVHH